MCTPIYRSSANFIKFPALPQNSRHQNREMKLFYEDRRTLVTKLTVAFNNFFFESA